MAWQGRKEYGGTKMGLIRTLLEKLKNCCCIGTNKPDGVTTAVNRHSSFSSKQIIVKMGKSESWEFQAHPLVIWQNLKICFRRSERDRASVAVGSPLSNGGLVNLLPDDRRFSSALDWWSSISGFARYARCGEKGEKQHSDGKTPF